MNFGALGNFAHRLKLLRTLPPRLVLAKIAKRFPFLNCRAVRVAEILYSPKDLNPDRLIEFFRDQEDYLIKYNAWHPIDFTGLKVIEVGPGPLAGWGPMAIFRGASHVLGIEPDWVDGVLHDRSVRKAYLCPHYRALVETFGEMMSYDEFLGRLDDRLVVRDVGLEQIKTVFRADIVVSNSCLEHIGDLLKSLRRLKNLSAPNARHMHLVNFGNHRSRLSPFKTIYEMSPDSYRLKYGGHINLLRASEVYNFFSEVGVGMDVLPVDVSLEKFESVTLHEYWRENFEPEDLAIRTALFISKEEEDGL